MKISTIKYYFFILHSTIKSVLIDKASPTNMPVDMSIVPHPHFSIFFQTDFEVTSKKNASIVFQSNIGVIERYLLVDNTLMC